MVIALSRYWPSVHRKPASRIGGINLPKPSDKPNYFNPVIEAHQTTSRVIQQCIITADSVILVQDYFLRSEHCPDKSEAMHKADFDCSVHYRDLILGF